MDNLTTLPTGLTALTDPAIEDSVLGTMLNSEGHPLDCREDVIELFGSAGSKVLTVPSNQEIYDGLIRCLLTGNSTTPHGVIATLRKEGSLTQEIMERVHWLTGRADQPVGAVQGARVLKDLYRRRMVSRAMEDGALQVRSGKAEADAAIADAFHQVVQAVEEGTTPNTRYERDRLVDEGLGVILGLRSREPGILYGFPGLDERTSGMHPGQLSAVAARSGIGKTVIAGDIARDASQKQGVPVVFFSLEMSPGDLLQRRASAELGIPYNSIRENNLSAGERERIFGFAEKERENQNFRIEFVPGGTVGQIYLLARKAVRDMGAKLIIVDYAQSVKSDRGAEDPNLRMTEVVEGLHEMAMKLNVHVLLLAQLKKPQPGREEEAPTNVNEILYGTKIENAASTIVMLHRRYGEEGKPGSEAEAHTIKVRYGSVGVDELLFDGMRQRFLPPTARMASQGAW